MTPDWLQKWDKKLIGYAREAAVRHQLDPNWVLAIVQVESAGQTNAARYEPNWKYLVRPEFYAERLLVTKDTETQLQKFSWGLMQVMGSVGRQWGYPDHLHTLSDPIRGLEYGCKHLSSMRKRFPTGRDWIAAYNAGSPRKRPDGSYENEGYVKKVVAFWNELSDT